MMRSLWIAKTGMDAMQTNIDVISHNLANVNTNGYKRERPVFEDLLYQNLRQPGGATSQTTQMPTGLQLGTGVRTVATSRIHIEGNLQLTDGALDMAINGDGFFQIAQPDGTTAYTRDGSFQVDSQGNVVTSSGYALQPALQVPAGTSKVTVGKDGTVTAIVNNNSAAPVTLGTIQLATFINPPGLQSIGENFYLETAASGAPTVGTPGTNGIGAINQGYVETSNVNVTEELINMIQAQRAFEINSKAVTTSDQMLQKLTQL
ncbi:flagellar basal-body rod protein FlgG [Andreprevotia lacus DSM 23236]|jgi:flagellar basal-body rod protein FlgG|uniref:Flagellar basal-body rod protein FlgG n=1 Tax=Andreprevotia lacus DSM 23236 TaxID=1121001 RepID=A0A1W1WYM0_9NEIS|nr:flagellar basal-body rod protein FlgG [Andreprevotia lacus]SMC16819.1 flagellar basal-body rod protein FlgG [Andreprevotia lacus DSM 23236]